MKLLIVKISSLGDIVHSFAFVNALTAQKPDIVIDWVTGDLYKELVGQVKGVRKVLPFRRKDWGRNWWKPSTAKEIFKLLREIRREEYDICLDLQGLLRSGLITLLSGARIRAGFADAREGSRDMYNRFIDVGVKSHAVEKLLKALELFDLQEPKNPDFGFTVPLESESAAKILLDSLGVRGKYAVFHAGARWKTKMWPEEYWRELVEEIQKVMELPILFSGSQADLETVGKILKGGGGSLFNIAGKADLLELAAILKGAEFMVTVDSGPMHVAAAFGVPLVALFGPTSPLKTGPVTRGKVKVYHPNIYCAPCMKRECAEENYRCMEELSPSLIKSGIIEMLKEV